MRTIVVLAALAVSTVAGARLRKNQLQDKFKQFYELRADDFHLAFTNGDGRAEFIIYNVLDDSDIKLRMSEDLFIFDTSSHPDIEMCNGTVENLKTGRVGVTFGTIDRNTKVFRGQFIINGTTCYVEDADKFLNDTATTGVKSILYCDVDVIFGKGDFEPKTIPVAEQRRILNPKALDNNVCTVEFRVDPGVWNAHKGDKNKIRSVIYQHMMTVNSIFKSELKVGQDQAPIRFAVGRIAYHDDRTCETHPGSTLCHKGADEDSDAFVRRYAEEFPSEHCINILYTSKTFGSVLGIAFIGGVCTLGEFNAGFVVLDTSTTQFAMDLTFAHEVGHLWGANHDTGACDGNALEGRFLMTSHASVTKRPNDRKLSQCSRRDIAGIFRNMKSGRHPNCLVKHREALSEQFSTVDEGINTLLNSVENKLSNSAEKVRAHIHVLGFACLYCVLMELLS